MSTIRQQNLDTILARCLDDMQRGTATVDQCLCSYPQNRVELEPLLRLAAGMHAERKVQPPSSARERMRARVMAQVAPAPRHETALLQARALLDRVIAWVRAIATNPQALRPQLTPVLLLIACLLAGTGGIAYAADEFLPRDPLYRVRTGLEGARLALAPSNLERAHIHLALAEKRLREMEQLEVREEHANLVAMASEYYYNLDKAHRMLHMALGSGELANREEADPGGHMAQSIGRQQAILERVIPSAPAEAQPALRQAHDICRDW